MKNILVYSCILILLFSCAKDLKKETPFVHKVDYKEELHAFFKTNFNVLDSAQIIRKVALENISEINNFYREVGHNPIWINDSVELNSKGSILLKKLADAKEYGLFSVLYATDLLNKIKNELTAIKSKKERYRIASELELLLTNSYMLFGKHLNYGFLDTIDSITVLPRKEFKIDLSGHMIESQKKNNLIGGLLELQPKENAYRELQIQLSSFLKNSSLSKEKIKVINFRIDSIKSIRQAKNALVHHKYLDSISSDSIFIVALKKFQKDHGLKVDGKIGKNTASTLSKSPYQYYETLITNLERWRWKEKLPRDYLFVNIPAYQLEIYENNLLRYKHNTVIGKYKSQTPEIRDSLKVIVAYPYWYVPKKISLEEVLIKTQKDSTYFERNNFEVITYKKDSVDFNSLNWDEINKGKFNYLVRQKGGGSNSLGLVKFIFPNKHAIYLHDTPAKGLFYKEKRDYSHGCVRVHNAMKLADYILEYDENEKTIDSVRQYIKNQKEKTIKLNKRLPVLLYYFTAKVDENDQLIFYQDVYNTDKLVVEQMENIKNKYASRLN